ncbi:hypothetical protein [Methanosarcina sp. WWM596]|uniref:hypothetical protein n=1 Tax=Methanosarcina sp. WWM596 TaxID=1434103 RepID=UPI00064E4D80
MNTRVSIVCCGDYSKAKDAIKESLNLIGGLETIISPGNRLLLKPDVLSIRPPENAVTTHPVVVAAMCELVNGYWAEEKRCLSVKKCGKYLYGFHCKIGKAPQ